MFPAIHVVAFNSVLLTQRLYHPRFPGITQPSLCSPCHAANRFNTQLRRTIPALSLHANLIPFLSARSTNCVPILTLCQAKLESKQKKSNPRVENYGK